MNRILFTLLWLLMSIASLHAQMETAIQAAAHMGPGWNLGNTLDSNSGDTLNMWIEHWSDRSPAAYESSWGQVPATRELIHMLKEAGFGAIRVPVTWYPHMEAKIQFTSSSNSIWMPSKDPIGTQIDSAWMARVQEVVDYVIDEGMYCILNIHHDTGTSNTHWIIADETSYWEHKAAFESVWTQIAERFKNYDHHLLFEGYNEMTDSYDSWCFASFAAPGNYNAAAATSAYNAINRYAQSFVDAVRATGGNNSYRNLIVNTYAASCGDGDWSPHLSEPLTRMQLPNDPVAGDGHLFFEVHYYPNFATVAEGQSNVLSVIDKLNRNLVSKGAPVIIGEWGSGGGISYTNQKNDYLDFAEFFTSKATANHMPTFYWMGISDGSDRSVPKLTEPDLAAAIKRGYLQQTAIDDVLTKPTNPVIYSLTGMPLGTDPSVLPSGCYIQNATIIFVP